MKKEKIIKMIEKISPMAKEFVEEFYDKVVIIYVNENKSTEGVFLKVRLEDLCIYYACFRDDSPLEILIKIKEEFIENPFTATEICFNVYGKNERIIEFVQLNNFVLDMEGYILKHKGKAPKIDCLCEIMENGYIPDKLNDYVDLFDKAYEKLNIENGWDPKSYSKDPVRFGKELQQLSNNGRIKSFWKNGILIGCYIIDGIYIRDLVVYPRFQGFGYGTMFLQHCIRYMKEEIDISNIYLRITKSNTGAKRLYERNRFVVISNFAEHTYIGK